MARQTLDVLCVRSHRSGIVSGKLEIAPTTRKHQEVADGVVASIREASQFLAEVLQVCQR